MTIINKNKILMAIIVISGSCWALGYIITDTLNIQNLNIFEEFIFGVGFLTAITMFVSFLSEFSKKEN